MLQRFSSNEVESLVLCEPGAAFAAFKAAGFQVKPIPPLSMFGSSAGLPFRGLRLLDLLNILLGIRSGPAIRAAIREFRPDIVHVNERTLLHAAWVARGQGVPVVMHARNVADRETKWVHRLSIRLLRRFSDAVIAIDESVKYSIREIDNCEVIYNPGRVEGRDPIRTETGSPKETVAKPVQRIERRVRFLYLAILRDFKGIWDFLEAARILKDRDDVEFLVAGGNSRPAEFYQTRRAKLVAPFGFAPDVQRQVFDYVRKHELVSNVRLLGHVSDVEAVMADADVNVFPSWLNGPSRSVFECGMRGIPSILALRDRIEDVVEHERTGLIVPDRNPQALADAMVRLADDPDFRCRLGENARSKYCDQFEPRGVASQVLDVYRKVLTSSR